MVSIMPRAKVLLIAVVALMILFTGVFTPEEVSAETTPKSIKVIYYGNGGMSKVKGSSFTLNPAYSQTGTTTIAGNWFIRDGYQFVGWATAPNKGDVTGPVTNRKPVGKVSMKRFQLGNVVYKWGQKVRVSDLYKKRSSDGIVRLYAVWKGKGPKAAADWACLIAADNKFNYGVSGVWHGKKQRREHCAGCYYCGTNRWKWNGSYRYKEATPNSAWDRTYCCNPFVSAAYSHGANHSNTCIFGNMDYPSWKKYDNSHGRFVKIAKKGIKVGDIFYNGGHVWMYVGNGCIAEATDLGWKPQSIRVIKGTRLNKAVGVIRYAPR